MGDTDLLAVGGITLIVSVVLVCLLKRRRQGAWARWDGERQSINIRIEGAYSPHRIVLQRGRPTVLRFERTEERTCSEWLLIPELGVKHRLPPQTTTEIQFIPELPGEYLFTCTLGIYVGTLTVLPERRRLPWLARLPSLQYTRGDAMVPQAYNGREEETGEIPHSSS